MRELNVNDLRALIRLISPLRALREDIEKSLLLELYTGSGNLAVRSLEALRDQVLEITQDRYVAALTLDDVPGGGDREKFSQVLLVSGQLLAYLEAQTGVDVASANKKQQYSVQTAPNISLNMGDVVSGQADKIMDFVEGAMNNAMRGIRPPKPPKPPRRPEPPPRPDFGDHFPGGKSKRGEGFFYESDDEDEV
jgi:hypothetical protein